MSGGHTETAPPVTLFLELHTSACSLVPTSGGTPGFPDLAAPARPTDRPTETEQVHRIVALVITSPKGREAKWISIPTSTTPGISICVLVINTTDQPLPWLRRVSQDILIHIAVIFVAGNKVVIVGFARGRLIDDKPQSLDINVVLVQK